MHKSAKAGLCAATIKPYIAPAQWKSVFAARG
jgi:hypothetical protein